MVTITEKKILKAVRFEAIIKRCPVCLKDTEQAAYYAKSPDLSIKVRTDTDPQLVMTVYPKIAHRYEWDVLARCSQCGYTYRVMGVPKMKIKDIPKGVVAEEHEIALTCCDLCYHEYYRYTISEIFINLTNYGKVYLCEEHAQEAEQEKKKEGAYTSLAARLSRWSSAKEKPFVISLEGGRQLILRSEKGLNKQILLEIAEAGALATREIASLNSAKGASRQQIDDSISYLKGMNLVHEEHGGFVIKKPKLTLTDDGRLAADALRNEYKA